MFRNNEKETAVLLNLQSLLEKKLHVGYSSVLSSYFISHFILLPFFPLKPVLKEALGLSVICSGSALIPPERRGSDGAHTHRIYMVTAKTPSLSSRGVRREHPSSSHCVEGFLKFLSPRIPSFFPSFPKLGYVMLYNLSERSFPKCCKGTNSL